MLYRRNNPERLAEIEKKKNEKRKDDPEYKRKKIEYQRIHRKSIVMQSHNAVERYLKKSKPRYCEVCKTRPARYGHHPNYEKPLEIQWLCPLCHNRFHHSIMGI